MKVWIVSAVLVAATCISAALLRPAMGAAPAVPRCGGYGSPPPMVFTPSPEQVARARAWMRYRAMNIGMFAYPAKPPYEFVLKSYAQGFGPDAPAPPIRRDSLRFSLNRIGGVDASSHVHLLDEVPQTDQMPNPCDRRGVFAAGFAIDPRGLPAGMYVLRADAGVDPMTLDDGDVVSGAKAHLTEWRIYIPATAAQLPQKQLGQQFLLLPGESTLYRDASDREIPRRDIVMHTATLTHIDGDSIELAVQGTPYLLREKVAGSIAQIDGLLPMVEDVAVRDLNARYAGRSIWGRGGFGSECVLETAGGTLGASGPSDKPYRVKRVFRIYRSYYDLAIGAEIGAMGGERKSSFIDESPIVVWLDIPPDAEFTGIMGTGAMNIAARPAGSVPAAPATPAHLGPSDACVAYYMNFADTWDMERAYSLVPPPSRLGEMRAGLTREQVTWILGYPSEYAPISNLNRLSAWRYDNLQPFNYWVYFDAQGRVTKFGPDGQLP
jgi:hypothetical protein